MGEASSRFQGQRLGGPRAPEEVRLYYRIVGDGAQTLIVPLASLHGDRLHESLIGEN